MYKFDRRLGVRRMKETFGWRDGTVIWHLSFRHPTLVLLSNNIHSQYYKKRGEVIHQQTRIKIMNLLHHLGASNL